MLYPRWQFIFLSGTLAWLRGIFTDGELEDMPTLLKKVKANKPVSNMMGWAYYHACFVWGDKKAVRVGDHKRLDFM